ncbi:MAG: PRC-barrel domain-containing protein [Hyphomicrobiaceae bacterium]
MLKKLTTAGALAALMSITPAFAEGPQQPQQNAPAAQSVPQSSSPMGTKDLSDVKGWPVYSVDGSKVGDVKSVQASGTSGQQALQVETGGFMGMGTKTIEISADKFNKGDKRINLTLTANEFKALPTAGDTQSGSGSGSKTTR